MRHKKSADNFYEIIRPRLHWRIGHELRLAGRVLDLGCGPCDLVEYLAFAYRQTVTGVDVSSKKFPHRRHLSDGSRFHCIRKDAAPAGGGQVTPKGAVDHFRPGSIIILVIPKILVFGRIKHYLMRKLILGSKMQVFFGICPKSSWMWSQNGDMDLSRIIDALRALRYATAQTVAMD